MNRGPSPDTDDFPPSRLSPSPAAVFSTSTHRASCAVALLPAVGRKRRGAHCLPSRPPDELPGHSRAPSETSVRAVLNGCAPATPALLSTLCEGGEGLCDSPGAMLPRWGPHCGCMCRCRLGLARGQRTWASETRAAPGSVPALRVASSGPWCDRAGHTVFLSLSCKLFLADESLSFYTCALSFPYDFPQQATTQTLAFPEDTPQPGAALSAWTPPSQLSTYQPLQSSQEDGSAQGLPS